jgi:hypothetical protein
MLRLDADAPSVAECLRLANPTELRRIIGEACNQAIIASGIDDALVRRGADVLHTADGNALLATALASLAEQLDQQYFDAQQHSDPTWMNLFRQARTASALSLGLVANDAATAAECVYEAAHALDDPGLVYSAVLSA